MTLAACLGQVWVGCSISKSMPKSLCSLSALWPCLPLRVISGGFIIRVRISGLRAPPCAICVVALTALGWMGLAGIASFISLTGGIPSQIYLLPINLPRAYYVGTMGWSFLLVNLAKLPFFIELGLFDAASLTASLALAGFVPIGVALGLWLNRAMNDAWFYHISHFFLLLLGLQLSWQADIW